MRTLGAVFVITSAEGRPTSDSLHQKGKYCSLAYLFKAYYPSCLNPALCWMTTQVWLNLLQRVFSLASWAARGSKKIPIAVGVAVDWASRAPQVRDRCVLQTYPVTASPLDPGITLAQSGAVKINNDTSDEAPLSNRKGLASYLFRTCFLLLLDKFSACPRSEPWAHFSFPSLILIESSNRISCLQFHLWPHDPLSLLHTMPPPQETLRWPAIHRSC